MTQLNLFERKAKDRRIDERKAKWQAEQRVARDHLRVARQILNAKKSADFKRLTEIF
jgi:hypothetical protein